MEIPICAICQMKLYKRKADHHPKSFCDKVCSNITYDYYNLKEFKGKRFYHDTWDDKIYHISCYKNRP